MGGLDDIPADLSSPPRRAKSPKARIKAETVSLSDFQGLVQLLVQLARDIDKPGTGGPLKKRLDKLFKNRRAILR